MCFEWLFTARKRSPVNTEMEMEAAVNRLPDEILERIFSYCTHRDLVRSIQNVCCRWREVAQSTSLWKDVTYRPGYCTKYEQVVKRLKTSPKLQNINLQYHRDGRVLQAITDNCAELRKLEISPVHSIDMKFIRNLQEKCPKVEYLNIPHPVCTASNIFPKIFKSEEVGKFTNLKFLHLTGSEPISFSLILKPVADYCKKLEHLSLDSHDFEINHLCYLISMRKDTLHTLAVHCYNKSHECVLPALSTSKLKSLSLLGHDSCPRHDEKIEHLRQLKTVKALSITIYSSKDLKQVFENENMAQLVELNLDESEDFDNDFTEVIVRNCPLLKKLSLKCLDNVNDATLKTLTNLKELNSLTISGRFCVTDTGILNLQDIKNLKHLTISWCTVGLRNIAKLCTLQDLTLEGEDLAEFPWDLIPHRMQYLKRIQLRYCTNVDVCAIEKLTTLLPYLKVLK